MCLASLRWLVHTFLSAISVNHPCSHTFFGKISLVDCLADGLVNFEVFFESAIPVFIPFGPQRHSGMAASLEWLTGIFRRRPVF